MQLPSLSRMALMVSESGRFQGVLRHLQYFQLFSSLPFGLSYWPILVLKFCVIGFADTFNYLMHVENLRIEFHTTIHVTTTA